jgi:hypothetical protein
MKKIILFGFVLSGIIASAKTTVTRIDTPLISEEALTLSNSAVTAQTNSVQICNFSDISAAMKSCNNMLSTLSLLSNDGLQITGGCTSDTSSMYCAILKGRATIIKP